MKTLMFGMGTGEIMLIIVVLLVILLVIPMLLVLFLRLTGRENKKDPRSSDKR